MALICTSPLWDQKLGVCYRATTEENGKTFVIRRGRVENVTVKPLPSSQPFLFRTGLLLVREVGHQLSRLVKFQP